MFIFTVMGLRDGGVGSDSFGRVRVGYIGVDEGGWALVGLKGGEWVGTVFGCVEV